MKMRGIMICLVVLILCKFVPKCEPFNKVCFEKCLRSCNLENNALNVHNKDNCVGKCTLSLHDEKQSKICIYSCRQRCKKLKLSP
ncbi:unnamed protein product [Amaranthus hypochondriacus]